MIENIQKNIELKSDSFLYSLAKKDHFDLVLYNKLLDELNSLIKSREDEDIIFMQKNISGLMNLVKNLFVSYISHNDVDDIIDVDFSELGENVDDEKIYETIHIIAHKLIVLAGKIDNTPSSSSHNCPRSHNVIKLRNYRLNL